MRNDSIQDKDTSELWEVYDPQQHEHYQNGGLCLNGSEFWGGHDGAFPCPTDLDRVARCMNTHASLRAACRAARVVIADRDNMGSKAWDDAAEAAVEDIDAALAKIESPTTEA